MRLRFLGTGASGGTPGEGRSRRRESSLLVTCDVTTVLVDATRDLEAQVTDPGAIDALVLTHAHRDASGGVPALRHLARSAPRSGSTRSSASSRDRFGAFRTAVERAGDHLRVRFPGWPVRVGTDVVFLDGPTPLWW